MKKMQKTHYQKIEQKNKTKYWNERKRGNIKNVRRKEMTLSTIVMLSKCIKLDKSH